MAAIQALKKAKSLAPASGILPPKAAEGIIKTNASPQGLTFCHKVIRTVRKYQATASHIRHGIRRWHRISEMDCRRRRLHLFIPEAVYSYLKPTRWLMPQSTALSR